MKYGFVGQIYKLMRAGDTDGFRQLLKAHPQSALNQPADGCVAPVLISAVFARRVDYLAELLDAGAAPNLRDTSSQGSAHNLCALHAALWFQRTDMVDLLRARGATEDFGTAVFGGNVDTVKSALE
ncbi:MAG: hypothetical protein AAGG51_08200 [Cyanobacteria bacterium P01_G01_bin.54]